MKTKIKIEDENKDNKTPFINKKNNSTSDSHYILKGLIGQIDLLKFKSFLFDILIKILL